MCARVLLRGVLALLLLAFIVPSVSAQEPTPDPAMPDPVLEIMEQMPPEMKVGQLVLVSFPGVDVGENTEIATLIRDYGVGGVLLSPQNGNFDHAGILPSTSISITNRLQSYAWESSILFSLPVTGGIESAYAPSYIPLFVTIEANMRGVPVSRFVSHTVSLAKPMALGATWDRTLAEATGSVLGKDLATTGINLFLGPDLDVLYTPRPGDPSDLGTNSFGGDPFWVGELGKAYIRGLKQGSQGKLLVAPRHLPGLGSADRILEEELPTVQQPLEQLKQIELAPFFAVARDVPGTENAADAFLVTHIRYRGFQGNIRSTTRPISLDAQALQLVTELEEVAPWRQAGGVLIADNLGLQSIHRSYDPRGLTFNARRVTQDALEAGNDLLILDHFSADENWAAHFTNITDTLEYLASRYKTDTTFQTIVDSAVYRLISMKLRIYPNFSLDAVQLDSEVALEGPSTEQQDVNAQVARQALTLIFPLSEDLLPPPPQKDEPIVIFSQQHYISPGEGMATFPLLRSQAIDDALMQFYGPDGTGVVRFDSVQSFTFEDLLSALATENVSVEEVPFPSAGETPTVVTGTVTPVPALEGPDPVSSAVLEALEESRWVVFATTGLNPKDPLGQALKTFLSKPVGSLDARIVVFAFGPPYELDSTEISKLDAYYALYSPGQAFVEASARALFRDLAIPGASPVDIPAINYYIPLQTMPDPAQLISLSLVDAAGDPLTSTENILIGDVINLRTGEIVDQNGHPVPDGTPVEFVLAYPQEGFDRRVVAETQEGVAITSVTLDRVGLLMITVQSEPALSSVRLELTTREEGGIAVETIEPTSTPTPTPSPTLTPTPPVATPTPTPVVPPPDRQLPDPIYLPLPRRSYLLGWGGAAALLVWIVGFVWARERGLGIVMAIRLAFWGMIGGLCGYVGVMAVGQWWIQSWHYTVVGREYIVGGITLLFGFITIFMGVVLGSVMRRIAHSKA